MICHRGLRLGFKSEDRLHQGDAIMAVSRSYMVLKQSNGGDAFGVGTVGTFK